MKYIFKFPDIGEGLDEGTIIEWQIKKGQRVSVGDSLVTMETDKVVTDIPAPKEGTITATYGKTGEIIHVGDALVEIEIEGVAGAAAIEENTSETVKEEGAGVVGTLEIAGNSAILAASDEGAEIEKEKLPKPKKALATPVARAMAKDLGIDINAIKGSGPGGRVMKDDIKNYSKHKSYKQNTVHSTENQDEAMRVDIEPMSQLRKTIAKNMIRSKISAAHMTIFEEVEVSELDRIRKKYKQEFLEKGTKLTYLAFVVKATAMALKKYRSINSEMDMEKGIMIYKNYYNIGIAVDTEKGLVVPVIKNADKLSIYAISAQINELSTKARNSQLSMDDIRDGTFTITSYGNIGGIFAVPVINYPQAGILGIGRISKQAIVKEDKLAIGLMMPLSLAVDHRIADGGETARFINQIMAYLAEPVSLIMD